jgi:hypothetical protein
VKFFKLLKRKLKVTKNVSLSNKRW